MISKKEVQRIIDEVEERPTLDYKEDLVLETDGDKAQFVKDVIALANTGKTVHIIIGVEDITRKLKSIKTHHKPEQLNQILKDKSDPPLSVEYTEQNIMGHIIGVIEIVGDDPPYIVAVHDRYGGCLSSDPQKKFHIERGTVFIRNGNMNEGAKRADLDKMYKVKYATSQTDLELSNEVSLKQLEDSKEIDISFFLTNRGDIVATAACVWIQFQNIREIVKCIGLWKDVSNLNENTPTIQFVSPIPIAITTNCDGVVVRLEKDIKQIKTRAVIGATNMRTKDGPYAIMLKK